MSFRTRNLMSATFI